MEMYFDVVCKFMFLFQSKAAPAAKAAPKGGKASASNSVGNDDEPSWHLGRNKHVKVRSFKGQTYIDIRNEWMILFDVMMFVRMRKRVEVNIVQTYQWELSVICK